MNSREFAERNGIKEHLFINNTARLGEQTEQYWKVQYAAWKNAEDVYLQWAA